LTTVPTITTKNGTFNLNNVALDATITISFIGYQSSQFTNELFSAEKMQENPLETF
jgi:hypothetical protein